MPGGCAICQGQGQKGLAQTPLGIEQGQALTRQNRVKDVFALGKIKALRERKRKIEAEL